MTQPVLLDNTVLSNFALVLRTDLPGALWPDAVCTTQAAFNEYQAGVTNGLLPASAWADLAIIAMTAQELAAAAALGARLGVWGRVYSLTGLLSPYAAPKGGMLIA